jgi:serine/threonine protein kinase/tetratricopeptide (TPR) repeat protein
MGLPRTIDRYTIESVLGQGGMGRVYLALDPRLGRRVALKVLLAEGANERARAVAKARMLREARAAAAFNHPNVVAVYDVGEVDDNPFIAMELVSGATLRECMADKRVSVEQRLAWLLEVARGLAAAHRVGLVHRDVKPENVMITDDGIVKILDFGLARAAEVEQGVDPVGATLATPTVTATGVTVGTPQYMPPEQLEGERLDGRADQFAWAVVAWEALAGVSPWGERVGLPLFSAVLNEAVPPLSEKVPGIERRVSDAVARALEKDKAARFPVMEELIAAIEGPDARPPSPGSTRRPVQVHDTEGRGLAQPTPEPARTPTNRRRARAALVAGAVVAALAGSWLALHPSSDVGKPTTAASASASTSASTATPSDSAAPGTPSLSPELAPFFARAAAAEREGRHDKACDEYRHASDTHPDSADAALAAMLCYRIDAAGGRPYYRRAWGLRAALSPRDGAILDAYEPFFQRDPIDFKEEKARLEAAVARFPNDAALHYYLSGSYRLDSFDAKRAIGEIDRAIALDPSQPHVMAIAADFHSYDGDFAGSHAMIDRCLRAAPAAIECLQEEQWLDSEEGDCARVEAAARRMLAIDPSYVAGVRSLANALYARGDSVDTVRALLQRAHGAGVGGSASREDRLDAAHTAMLAGDFAAAEKVVRELADAAATSTVAADHGLTARLLVAIDRETGRDADAAAIARAYLEGRDAWEPAPDFDDWAMIDEPTPTMLAARLKVGALSRGDYDAEIDRTVARWSERATPATRSFVWIYTFATPAETPADARAALARLGPFEPVPRFKPLSLADEAIGRTYLLAGRTDDALAALERATRSCFPLDHPMEHTRAHYALGLAREAKGDVDGACAAYRVVRRRWGGAHPRSITADLAAARVAALRCPKASP